MSYSCVNYQCYIPEYGGEPWHRLEHLITGGVRQQRGEVDFKQIDCPGNLKSLGYFRVQFPKNSQPATVDNNGRLLTRMQTLVFTLFKAGTDPQPAEETFYHSLGSVKIK